MFDGDVECSGLEDVYAMFNETCPESFTGHSLSVSDIVEIENSDIVEKGFYFCDSFGFKKIDFEPSKQVVELSYRNMSEIFRFINNTHMKSVSGYIVFSQDSFDKPYSEQSRTYVVSSDNKAYIAGAGGYSIFGSCLDGSDQNIRLERYMHGDNAWKIERCYMQRDDYEYAHSQQVKNKDNLEER